MMGLASTRLEGGGRNDEEGWEATRLGGSERETNEDVLCILRF